MSVQVKSTPSASAPKMASAVLVNVLWFVVAFVQRLATLFAAGSLAVGVWCFVCMDSLPFTGIAYVHVGTWAGVVIFAESFVACALYAVLFRQLELLLADIKAGREDFFARQPHRLRRAAAALLALAAFGLIFSLTASALANGVATINFSFNMGAFPANSVWYALFDSVRNSTSFTAQVDLGAIALACVLWVLAPVFEYAAWLQDEQMGTV